MGKRSKTSFINTALCKENKFFKTNDLARISEIVSLKKVQTSVMNRYFLVAKICYKKAAVIKKQQPLKLHLINCCLSQPAKQKKSLETTFLRSTITQVLQELNA